MGINKGIAFPASSANQDDQTALLQAISDNITNLLNTDVSEQGILLAIQNGLAASQTGDATAAKQDQQTTLLTGLSNAVANLFASQATASKQDQQIALLNAIQLGFTGQSTAGKQDDQTTLLNTISQLLAAEATGVKQDAQTTLLDAIRVLLAQQSNFLKVTDFELTQTNDLTGFFDVVNPDGGAASLSGGVVTITSPNENTGLKNIFLYSKKIFSLPLQSMFSIKDYGSNQILTINQKENWEAGFVSVNPITGLVDFNNYVSIAASEYTYTSTYTLYETRVRVCNNGVLIEKEFYKQPTIEKHNLSAGNPKTAQDQTAQITINHKGVFLEYGISGMVTYNQRTDFLQETPDLSLGYKFFIRASNPAGNSFAYTRDFDFLRVFESGLPRIQTEIVAYNKVPVYFPEPPEILIAGGSVTVNAPSGGLPVVFSGTQPIIGNVTITGVPTVGFYNAYGQEAKGAIAANASVNYPAKDAVKTGAQGLTIRYNRWGIYLTQPGASAQISVSDDGLTWTLDPDYTTNLAVNKINKIDVPVYWRYARLTIVNGGNAQAAANIQYSQTCNS